MSKTFNLSLACAIIFALTLTNAFEIGSYSHELNPTNFEEMIQKSHTTDFIVLLYSPNCKFSEEKVPTWANLSEQVETHNKSASRQIQTAHVNGVEHPVLLKRIEGEYYPSFFMFSNGRMRAIPTNFANDEQSLLRFATTDYIQVLPEIPGISRLILTKLVVYDLYTKAFVSFSDNPIPFFVTGGVLALGLLLTPFLRRKNSA